MSPHSATSQRGVGASPTRQTELPPVKMDDLCVGCIVWLPPRDLQNPPIKCSKAGCCGHGDLEDGGYNHPVVVLKIRQRKNSNVPGDLVCTVACITSFRNIKLPKYLEIRPTTNHLHGSIPIIDPEAELPGSGETFSYPHLQLEEGKLRKQSYVRLKHIYRVPANFLRQYTFWHSRAYKYRLCKTSYDQLMEELRLAPEPFECTATLFETKERRLYTLASSNGAATLPLPTPAVPPQRVYSSTSFVEPPPRHDLESGYGTVLSRDHISYYGHDAQRYHQSTLPAEEGLVPLFWKCVVGTLAFGASAWGYFSLKKE